MRDPSDNVPELSQHRLILRPPKRGPFIVLDRWMAKLPVTRGAKIVYGALLSLQNAGMRVRAQDVVAFTQDTPRSYRRHLAELERAELIIRRPQFRDGRRLENRYDFLWQPVIPKELKGAPYAPHVREQADAGGRHHRDDEGRMPLTAASGQLSTAKKLKQQAGKSAENHELELPAELASSLEKAAPGQVADCLRVVREACSDLPAERARPVMLNALRRLIQRGERGGLSNPPGLLRVCLVPEALVAENDVVQGCERLRAELAHSDALLTHARSGFELLRRMRKRELMVNAYIQHAKAAFGSEPSEVLAIAVDDPELARLLRDVQSLQRAVRAARESGDALKVNRIQDDLHRLERGLDEYLQKRRARVS